MVCYQNVDPTSATISEILQFLQSGLDRGLSPSTLRWQVAALATVLTGEGRQPLSHDPKIKAFLRGAVNLSPPVIHRFPTWDLTLVLQALTSNPFEPLASVTL